MGRVEGTLSMLWLNEEAGWTLFQFSAVDLSVWVGGLVCSASPHAEKGKTAQPFPPDKKGRNTASKPRRVRDSSEPPILSRPNPHTRGRQGRRRSARFEPSSTLTTQRPPALPVIDSFVFQRSPSGTKRTRRPSILSSVCRIASRGVYTYFARQGKALP